MRRWAFTLIELLVVVTIIAVLLALLAPALDKAVYYAQLIHCAANQHAIGNGAQVYAVDHTRHYPDRSRAIAGEGNYASNWLTEPESGLDLRAVVKNHIPVQSFEDPLSPRIDVREHGIPEDRDTYVHANDCFYFGWRFSTGGDTAMNRLGDGFTWATGRFTAMVADLDWNTVGFGVTLCSHPDRDGILYEEKPQDVQDPASATLLGYPKGRFTFGRWVQVSGRPRGPMEMNFTYADGSTERFDAVETDDSRMTKIPLPTGDPSALQQLPPR